MSCKEDASVSNCDAWDAGGVADKVMALATPTVPQGGLQLANRVILHIDLDCFYAQVEQKRLGIPRDVPCAVQQWNGEAAAAAKQYMVCNPAAGVQASLLVQGPQIMKSLAFGHCMCWTLLP